jgi:hypothetical protein
MPWKSPAFASRSVIRRLVIAVIGSIVIPCGGAAHGQTQDAHVIPRGLLRIGFEPHYQNYDRRFALNTPGVTDGSVELLGTDLTADSVGSNFFPAVRAAEAAIADIIGDPGYRINVGAFRTARDVDTRRFPISLRFGLTNRLTLTAYVPIVTHRSQIAFTNDTTDANAGLNAALAEFGGADGAGRAAALLAELTAAIGDVQAAIDASSFGCPSSTQCDQARAAVTRASSLLDNLSVVTGAQTDAGGIPSFAPLLGSTAGFAIANEIAAVSAELSSFGASSLVGQLPLPVARASGEDINGLLSSATAGYTALPLEFIRGTGFGDIEVGARYGLIQSPTLRTVLVTTVRLPTGKPDLADHFADLGTGDGQPDVVFGFEAAYETGALGLVAGASYTMQLEDQLVRRIAPPDSSLVPETSRAMVTRKLGDELHVSAHPVLRLDRSFRVFGSISYYYKRADRFSLDGSSTADPLFPPEALSRETAMRALRFGGGIAYRTELDPGSQRMPIEAGLSYTSTFSGSGGLTPKANDLRLYLRLFYRVFVGASPPSEESVNR